MPSDRDDDALDLDAVLRGLDAIFDSHEGATRAEPFLLAALSAAERLHDDGAQLSLLNELIGFYRSQSRHDDAVAAADRALAAADRMGITGTAAHASTLINAATAQRAAGHYDDALSLYDQALVVSEAVLAPADRRLAALHNNLSILLSDLGDQPRAAAELLAALTILEASSPDPAQDVEIATTCTNLALVCFSLGQDADAAAHVERSMTIHRTGSHEKDGHHAAAVAGAGEACFRMGRLSDAAAMYRTALVIIEECYGRDTDAYAVTAANLAEVEAAEREAPGAPAPRPTSPPAATHGPTHAPLTGLALAREYWEAYRVRLLEDFPHHRGRIAAGLVGHGSQCYGFDDETSRDHDFGPGFCLWLTPADHAEIGAELQARYDALPREFHGVPTHLGTPRASGAGRRVGVFEIGEFFEEITGHRQAPAADRPHEWLMLEEATLAAATNGAVFADPLGAFGAVRSGFVRMPRDVQLALVSRRLGMIAQAGQYNVPRMLARGDGEAAWLSVAELTRAAASVVFLLNGPASAGYLPYYKWQAAALRRLSRRMGSRLPRVSEDLSQVLRAASAACFGPDGGAGPAAARAGLVEAIERVCLQILTELRVRGLTTSDETFLERQRPFVAAHIEDDWLKSL